MKILTLAVVAMAVGFFAAVNLVHAQTVTPTVTPTTTTTTSPTPSPTSSSSNLPSGAPNTGFGF